MATTIRREVSKKNKYYISAHRTYELRHFCLQYPEWQIAITAFNYYQENKLDEVKARTLSSTVEAYADKLMQFEHKIDMVEEALHKTDEELYDWLILGITQGKSYEWLYTNRNIPCSKGTYYDRYRKFFYILDKLRD